MSHAIVRLATSADEPKIFALLTALMEGELVGDTPIEQSSAARNVFHDLLISERDCLRSRRRGSRRGHLVLRAGHTLRRYLGANGRTHC
jgi:hypothetical protein